MEASTELRQRSTIVRELSDGARWPRGLFHGAAAWQCAIVPAPTSAAAEVVVNEQAPSGHVSGRTVQ